MPPDYFDQSPYAIRFDWGPEGADRAAARGDVLVIVDVLCFSTCVAIALAHGAIIYPCRQHDNPAALAAATNAELAVRREEVPTRGRFSLSPETYVGVMAGTRVALRSANGAVCVRAAERAPAVLVGALVNATAVTREAERLAQQYQTAITVIACGERWSGNAEESDDGLRVALEDALGAGAILASLSGNASPEAIVCASAFRASVNDLATLLWECASGRELQERGYPEDVQHAAHLDAYDCAPRLLPPLSEAPGVPRIEAAGR